MTTVALLNLTFVAICTVIAVVVAGRPQVLAGRLAALEKAARRPVPVAVAVAERYAARSRGIHRWNVAATLLGVMVMAGLSLDQTAPSPSRMPFIG